MVRVVSQQKEKTWYSSRKRQVRDSG